VGHVVAREMNLDLRGMEMAASGALDPAKFMGQPDAPRAGYQAIMITVKPDCDADQATLAQWLRAVESRCPVGDNLANPTPMHVSLG
jgi:uncharacterized OsmC-like protein